MASEYDTFNHLKYQIVVDEYGSTHYYNSNGELHREEGPAVVVPGVLSLWWKNGKRHREDGPASIHANGIVLYYINDISLSKQEFEEWRAKNAK